MSLVTRNVWFSPSNNIWKWAIYQHLGKKKVVLFDGSEPLESSADEKSSEKLNVAREMEPIKTVGCFLYRTEFIKDGVKKVRWYNGKDIARAEELRHEDTEVYVL